MSKLLLASALLSNSPALTEDQSAVMDAVSPVQMCLQEALDTARIGVEQVTCETPQDSAFPLTAQFLVEPMEGHEELKSVQFFGEDRLWFKAEEKEEGPCDRTLLILPGYGETTTVYGAGDFLGSAFAGMDAAYPDDKLCVLGMNPAGKGTPGYEENQERLGAYGYKAMLAEHEALIGEARASFPDYFVGDATLLLHSMAGTYGLPVMEDLAKTDSLDHVILHSTVGSGPLTGINAPLLVNARRHILPALGQTLSGEGSIDLSLEERAQLMGEGSREAQAQVPASGKEFLTWALGSEGVSKKLREELEADTVTVDLVLGEDDALIPFGMSRDSVRALDHAYSEFVFPNTPHSHPLEMTDEQKRSWVYILSRTPEELNEASN